MLKITFRDCQAGLLLVLEGRLCGPWVRELRECWHRAASTLESRTATVDLKEVDFVDGEGQALLAEMQSAGVRLRAATPLIRGLLPKDAAVRGSQGGGCDRVEEKPARRRNVCPHTDVTKPHSGSV
jgi:anti-anti-sigma regulatory factor